MKTWFVFWVLATVLVGYAVTKFPDPDGCDHPWWLTAISVLLVGGALSAVPGCLALILGLP